MLVATELNEQYLELLKTCLLASIYPESSWRVLEPAAGSFLRKAFLRLMAKRGKLVVEAKPFNQQKRSEGTDWPLVGFTMIGRKRLDNVDFCIRSAVESGIDGDFVETGVWRGGSCIYARALLNQLGSDKLVWACDSFEGLPAPQSVNDRVDLSSIEYLKVSLETVQNSFREFGLLDSRVCFIKGWFCDSLPTAPIEHIAVLRLDGDTYSSTIDALTALYHKVSSGGYVIADDYGTWPECKRAVSEFLKDDPVTLVPIDGSGVYWRKP